MQKTKTKYIILLGDGMADWPIKAMGNKTPLEIAKKKALDFIAKNGVCGMVNTIPKGMPPGSDVANLAIIGYEVDQIYTGRGPIEAVSMGINLADNELAFRCNLVTIENGLMKDFSAGHISSTEAKKIIAELNQAFKHDKISFHHGVSYRHIAVMNDKYKDLNTTPPHDITGQAIEKYLPSSPSLNLRMRPEGELKLILEKAHQILANSKVNQKRIASGKLPATDIWFWSQGKKPRLEIFEKKHGLKGAVITAVDLLKGIGKLIGFATPKVKGATGFIDTNYTGKVAEAIKQLKTKNFIYLHIEAPDESGHTGDVKLKIRAIEDFSKKVVAPILKYQAKHPELHILLMPDHSTPCEIKTHSSEAVPFAIYYPRIKADKVQTFSEKSCAKGSLKFKKATELLNYFLA